MNSIYRIAANILIAGAVAAGMGGCGDQPPTAPAARLPAKPSPGQDIAALLKQAQSGNPSAQAALASRYLAGDGVPKDAAKALAWNQKSASQGNAVAQWHLGTLYRDGTGVTRDAAKGAEWIRKSAAQGNADAEYELGRMYKHGAGLAQDPAIAVGWLKQSAAQGHAGAQIELGHSYWMGLGVPEDHILGHAWEILAADAGDERAMLFLEVMVLSPADQAEAQLLSARWKKGQTIARANPPAASASGSAQRLPRGRGPED